MPAAFTIVLMLSACGQNTPRVSLSPHDMQRGLLNEHVPLTYSDLKPVIAQDEGSVDAGKLGG